MLHRDSVATRITNVYKFKVHGTINYESFSKILTDHSLFFSKTLNFFHIYIRRIQSSYLGFLLEHLWYNLQSNLHILHVRTLMSKT